MRYAIIFCMLGIVLGCGEEASVGNEGQDDTNANTGTWSLTGVINGYTLQSASKSAASHRDDYAALYTRVVLTDLDGYCSAIQGTGSCPGGERRWMEIKILGTSTGTYNVVSTNQPTGHEAEVTFQHIDDRCTLVENILHGESGTVTFSKIDLSDGGEVELSLNAATALGNVSGTITAPYCGG